MTPRREGIIVAFRHPSAEGCPTWSTTLGRALECGGLPAAYVGKPDALERWPRAKGDDASVIDCN